MRRRLTPRIHFTLIYFTLIVCLTFMIPGLAKAEAAAELMPQTAIALSSSGQENRTSLVFRWVTGTDVTESEIKYGKDPELKDAETITAAPTVSDPQGGIADNNLVHFRPVHAFTADLEGLEPGALYYYQIGSREAGYGEIKSFKAPALPGENRAFSFLVSPDTQGQTRENFENTKALYEYMAQQESDAAFLIHTGDLVEDGYSSDEWQYFYEAAAPLTDRMPLMASIGNHDGLGVDIYNTQYRARMDFTTLEAPEGLSKEAEGTVYAYEYGDALFICLNSYAPEPDQAVQKQFLLDHAAKTEKRWKIVFNHHSIYDPGASHYGLDHEYGQLMTQAGIDLVLNGHEHAYARSTQRTVSLEVGAQSLEKALPGEAPTYVTGGSVYDYAYGMQQGSDTSWNDVFFDLRVDQGGSGGGSIYAPGVYARVDVTSNVLTYTAYYKAAGEANPFQVIDTFSILKPQSDLKMPLGGSTAPEGVTFLFDSFGQEEGKYVARFNWTTPLDQRTSELYYARKADFMANGGRFTSLASGTSEKIDFRDALTEMSYTGLDEAYSVQPVRSHKAQSLALDTDTEYVYAVGDGGANMTSLAEPCSFRTPAASGDFGFLVFSDMQHNASSYEETLQEYDSEAAAILRKGLEDHPEAEMILSLGDQVNYAFDTWEWDAFFEANQKTFCGLPLYMGVGNHEFDGAGNEWVPGASWDPVDPTLRNLYGRYNPPQNGAGFYGGGDGTQPIASGMDALMYEAGNYFFTYKDTLFLFTDFKDQATDKWQADQQAWIRSVVKQNPARWRVLVLHKSLFGYRMDAPVPDWTEAMDDAGIDLVLMGHDHVYLRTKPYSRGQYVDMGKGTVYLTNASGNQDRRGDRLASKDPANVAFMMAQPVGPAYTYITITNDEIRVTSKAYDEQGQLLTLEENALVSNSPREYDLSAYQFPEAAQKSSALMVEAVSLEGYPKEGQTLLARVLPEGATAEVSWERSEDGENWAPLAGMDKTTYSLSAADIGTFIRARAVGTRYYTGNVESGALGPVTSMAGTGGTVVEIATAEDLSSLSESFGTEAFPANAAYRLTADLDMTGVSFAPIGGGETLEPFFGTFDGQGHTISGLAIQSDQDCVGFIAYLAKGAQLVNLNLENVVISGDGSTAGFAGASAGTIRNCSVKGSITGGGYTGGMVGTLHGGILKNNRADVAIRCKTGGGLIGGTNFDGYGAPFAVQETEIGNVVLNNLALGSIEGEEYTGALVGDMGGSSGCILQTFSGNAAFNAVEGSGAGLLYGYWSGSRPIVEEGPVNIYDQALYEGVELRDFLQPVFRGEPAESLKDPEILKGIGWDGDVDWDLATLMPKPVQSKDFSDDLITIVAESDGKGTISPQGYVLVKAGEDQTFTFTPNEYFELDTVLVDDVPQESAAADGSYTFVQVQEMHRISVTFRLKPDAGGQAPSVVSADATYVIGAGEHFIVEVDFGSGALGIIEDTRHSVETVKIFDESDALVFDLGGCFWIPGAKYGRPDNELEICYDDMEKRPEYANLVPGDYRLEIVFKDLNQSTYNIPLHVKTVE